MSKKIQVIMKHTFYFFIALTCSVNSYAIDDNGKPCPDIVVSGSDLNCYGDANGTASVSVANGSGNYGYSWSNGANSASINGLSAGTYTITVMDNVSGCAVTGAYVVDAPDAVSITSSQVNIKCKGNNTGAIDIGVLGGTTPYTYQWYNGVPAYISGSQDLTNLTAGNYSVTVKDAHNCTQVKSFTITEPAQFLNYSGVTTDASCSGYSNGAIDLSVWGGTPSYTYAWSTGALTEDVSGLSQGSYSVTIKDFNNCLMVANFNIIQPTPLNASVSTTDVNCFGESNGSATASVSGGISPYSYSWSNTSTLFSIDSPILNNIPADNYQVVVTDVNNCTTTATGTVNQPSDVQLSLTYNDVSCYGGTDGKIDLTVSGGTPGYTYTWTTGMGLYANSQDLLNIPANTYSVTVQDLHGCSKQLTQEIKQPLSPIAVSESRMNVLCYANNTGSIDLFTTGGTPPYSFSWTSGQSTEDISSLIAGTYSYVVLDSKMCSYSDTVLISQPLQPISEINTITNVNCFGGADGAIDLTVNGGTAPYTYVWNNSTFSLSFSNQDIANLPAETYAVLITDKNNCTLTDTLTVTEPPRLQSYVTGVDILCNSKNTGSIDLSVSGGTTPYQYSWNNGAITQDQLNLYAGFYKVLITDAHNCTLQDSVVLTQPQDSITYDYSVVNVKCNNGQDGSISVNAYGGTSPYSYTWSNGDVSSMADSLPSATYTFLVTDSHGCTVTDSVYVSQPNPLALNEQITVVSCYGLSDGAINLSPTGGTAPFKYMWYNSKYVLSNQQEDIIGFPADTYQVQVRDSNNCFFETFLTITQPDSLIVTYTKDIVSCNGGGNGNIDVTITGGNPSYITTWSSGDTTQDLTGIGAGEYVLHVVDQKSCKDSIDVIISQPDPIYISFQTTEVSCVDQHDGSAYAMPVGGNGGYTYVWSSGATSALADGLYGQSYVVDVTDILGCTAEDSVTVPRSSSGCVDPVNTFTPNGDAYNDTWVIDNMDLYPDAEVQIFNKWGNLLYKTNGIYNPWDGVINGQKLPSEVYYYIIKLNYKDRKPLTGDITIIR